MLTTYEAIVLFRNLPKDELATSVKRVSGFIFDKGGILRELLYMGLQRTPWRQSKNKIPFWEAHYMFYEFNVPKMKLPIITGELMRDTDVIRHCVVPMRTELDPIRTNAKIPNPQIDFNACTFEEENAPVPYRPQVVKLVELAQRTTKNKQRKRVKLDMNCDFYPFQR